MSTRLQRATVAGFAAQAGLTLPDEYNVNSDNMLVEGLIFTKSTNTRDSSSVESSLSFGNNGKNITVSNCTFTGSDAENPPYAAIHATSRFREDPNTTIAEDDDDDSPLMEVTLKDIIIEENSYREGGIIIASSSAFGYSHISFSIENLIVRGNTFTRANTASMEDTGSGLFGSVVLAAAGSSLTMKDVIIENNVFDRSVSPPITTSNLARSVQLLSGIEFDSNIFVEPATTCQGYAVYTALFDEGGSDIVGYDFGTCDLLLQEEEQETSPDEDEEQNSMDDSGSSKKGKKKSSSASKKGKKMKEKGVRRRVLRGEK